MPFDRILYFFYFLYIFGPEVEVLKTRITDALFAIVKFQSEEEEEEEEEMVAKLTNEMRKKTAPKETFKQMSERIYQRSPSIFWRFKDLYK